MIAMIGGLVQMIMEMKETVAEFVWHQGQPARQCELELNICGDSYGGFVLDCINIYHSICQQMNI